MRVTRVLDGVYQIKTPSPGDVSWQTNAYIVEGSDGHMLVDTGWDSQDALWALQEGSKGAGFKLRDINKVVITHIHPDHYGLASKVKQICGAEVAIHRVDADLISSRYRDFDDLLDRMEVLLRNNGVPEEELPQLKEASLWMQKYVTTESADVKLEDGDTVSNDSFKFEVIFTPGHSPGHVCLFERDRKFILTGDHVLYDTSPHVSVNPHSGDNPLSDYVSSLNKLARLKVHFVLPGHGPVFNALGLRIDEILQHHASRKNAIMNSLSNGLKTAYGVAQDIPWTAGGGSTAFRDLGVWDRRLAVTETLAHLRLLVEEDRVANVDMDGNSLYVAKD